MADSGNSGGGRLPSTFGEKLSFAAPVLLTTLVVSVLIAFVLVWVISGRLREDFEKKTNAIETEANATKKELSEAKKETSELKAKAEKLEAANAKLETQSKDLKDGLATTVKTLVQQGDNLTQVSKDIKTFIDGQKELDATQNQDLAKHDQKIKYIEEKLKKLDALEADVKGLRDVTGELKKEYIALKGDLGAVKAKGEITAEELDTLTERSRIFQLRVLQARAREAADAARSGDLKTLLQRLEE